MYVTSNRADDILTNLKSEGATVAPTITSLR